MATSGKIHGRFGVALLAGFDISSDATSVEYSSATQVAKSTGMNGAADETFTIGQNDNKVTLKGWFDDVASTGIYTALAALRDLSFVSSFLPAGDASQGFSAMMGLTEIPTDIKVNSPVGATVSLDANFQISGELDFGLVQFPRQLVTGTGSPVLASPGFDNGASSAAGAAAHFHILTPPSGGGTVSAFALQDSPDNVTFTTRMTSGLAGTVAGADRQSMNGSVARWTRAIFTLTTAQTATLFVAFKRF